MDPATLQLQVSRLSLSFHLGPLLLCMLERERGLGARTSRSLENLKSRFTATLLALSLPLSRMSYAPRMMHR